MVHGSGLNVECRGFRGKWTCAEKVSGKEVVNNYFTEMCSGSEAGSYLRLIDFVYHSTLGLRVIKERK